MNELAQKIAETLGETYRQPILQIERTVEVLGEEETQSLFEETLEIENEGGMLTSDKKRRRTPGGVFFKLIRDRYSREKRRIIFKKKKKKSRKGKLRDLSDAELLQLSHRSIKTRGEISTVKMTIIGRPGQVIEKDRVAITSMQADKPPTNLPRGLPKPPSAATVYVVYISMRQWRKVRDAVNSDPKDRLILEGYPVFDRRIKFSGLQGVMTLYAQSVTTTMIQRARREAQRAAAS